MKINWLGTAALTFALGIGGSAVVAQQEQPNRGEYTAASLTQQSQDEQRAREAQEAADAKRQSIREELQEQDNRIAGTAEPGEARQRQSEQAGRTAERFSHDGSRISLSSEQREMLRQAAQNSLTVGSTPGGGSGQTCVTLRRVPDNLARSDPDLAGYRYVAIGDQIVLVDPRQQKIVDVIE